MAGEQYATPKEWSVSIKSRSASRGEARIRPGIAPDLWPRNAFGTRLGLCQIRGAMLRGRLRRQAAWARPMGRGLHVSCLGVFFNTWPGPPTIALIRRHMSAGIVWRGAFPGPRRDSLGLGLSDAYRDSAGGLVSGSETVYEPHRLRENLEPIQSITLAANLSPILSSCPVCALISS